MNLLKYIHIPTLIISFIFGLIAIYYFSDDKRKIYVYPTPETVDITIYKDQANNCYKFEETEVPCPEQSKIALPKIQ